MFQILMKCFIFIVGTLMLINLVFASNLSITINSATYSVEKGWLCNTSSLYNAKKTTFTTSDLSGLCEMLGSQYVTNFNKTLRFPANKIYGGKSAVLAVSLIKRNLSSQKIESRMMVYFYATATPVILNQYGGPYVTTLDLLYWSNPIYNTTTKLIDSINAHYDTAFQDLSWNGLHEKENLYIPEIDIVKAHWHYINVELQRSTIPGDTFGPIYGLYSVINEHIPFSKNQYDLFTYTQYCNPFPYGGGGQSCAYMPDSGMTSPQFLFNLKYSSKDMYESYFGLTGSDGDSQRTETLNNVSGFVKTAEKHLVSDIFHHWILTIQPDTLKPDDGSFFHIKTLEPMSTHLTYRTMLITADDNNLPVFWSLDSGKGISQALLLPQSVDLAAHIGVVWHDSDITVINPTGNDLIAYGKTFEWLKNVSSKDTEVPALRYAV